MHREEHVFSREEKWGKEHLMPPMTTVLAKSICLLWENQSGYDDHPIIREEENVPGA